MSTRMKQKEIKYWRSLEHLHHQDAYLEKYKNEFREDASDLPQHMSRRNFLSLVSASMALAGLTACRRPVEKILPYVKAPENIIPGIANYYATTMPLMSGAVGVVVESHEGRPTKIEGNTLHPASKGGSNLQMQASILDLYDPDRAQRVHQNGIAKSWNAFLNFWQTHHPDLLSKKGKGLAVISESFSSPTLYHLKNEFHKTFPLAQWVTYEPVSDEAIISGFHMATGRAGLPRYRLDKARIIAAFDADFIQTESETAINIKEFAAGRNVDAADGQPSRLYVAEPAFTATGGMADHRLAVAGSRVGKLVIALAKLFAVQIPTFNLPNELSTAEQQWIQALANDLQKNRGQSLILAGRRQPAWIHALVHTLNQMLNNNGNTCIWYPLTDKTSSQLDGLKQLADKINAKEIEILIIAGGNPVYNAPADFNLAKQLKSIPSTIHLSHDLNETSKQSTWHLPRTHYLESWGDARALDGSLSIIQPLIAPLFNDCRSFLELLTLLISGNEGNGYELVRTTWNKLLTENDFENQWRRVLHDGILSDSQFNPMASKTVNNLPQQIAAAIQTSNTAKSGTQDMLELDLQSSPAIFDGRFANNGWLQELPDSVTKLSWDNAALISKTTAEKLMLQNEDVVSLTHRSLKIDLPVWIVPGHVDDCITAYLGYGRKSAGRIGTKRGFDLYPLRTTTNLYFIDNITLSKTDLSYPLACTQDHGSMEGRPLIRETTLDDYRSHPEFAREMVEHPPLVSLWKEHDYNRGYQWGMAIDLNACVGCNICVIACQSENNVPIVGKEQVRNGREMHWLRLDRYFSGDAASAKMASQPVACQHCENAPCEQVCPVAATVHDKEGLNLMTYNRCIGTRYCSNNCPYKVRRFNFFNYTKDLPEIVQLGQNPDVTVRSRGVMEKCTYCLQRISRAKIAAKNSGREIKDGDLQTACQQACPANAIFFGNINDPDSAVSKIKNLTRNYELLAELNVKPRTSYLARIRNPNPDMVEG
jgi:MoCo/4Fe-4S cofactor protein with predicted Tat translocation signal